MTPIKPGHLVSFYSEDLGGTMFGVVTSVNLTDSTCMIQDSPYSVQRMKAADLKVQGEAQLYDSEEEDISTWP